MERTRSTLSTVVVVVALIAGGCAGVGDPCGPDDDEVDASGFGFDFDRQCATGLVCVAGTCREPVASSSDADDYVENCAFDPCSWEPAGMRRFGEACSVDENCAEDMECLDRVEGALCAMRGTRSLGELCQADRQCGPEAICRVFEGEPRCFAVGDVPLYGACTSRGDCYGALECRLEERASVALCLRRVEELPPACEVDRDCQAGPCVGGICVQDALGG